MSFHIYKIVQHLGYVWIDGMRCQMEQSGTLYNGMERNGVEWNKIHIPLFGHFKMERNKISIPLFMN
jgi:hypothetical protein